MKLGRPKKYNIYDLSGEFGIGYTSKKEEFYFDLEDYEKIKDYTWNVHGNYVEAKDKDGSDKIVKLHRIIMDVTDGKILVDHVDRKGINNRKYNLRIVSVRENNFNGGERKNNKTGVRGVSYRPDNEKYRVRIGKDYKEKTIGHFDTLEEAIAARKNAEKEYYGEYARID